MSDRAAVRGSVVGYAVAMLLLVGAAVALAGDRPAIAIGAFAAWLIQVAAFWRLEAALGEGRDATRAWLGGLAARAGGLIAAAAAAVVGLAGSELPVAYGLALLVFLLAEAGWLARRSTSVSGWTGSSRGDGRVRGTRTAG